MSRSRNQSHAGRGVAGVCQEKERREHGSLLAMDVDLMRFIFPIPPGLPPLADSSNVAIIGKEKTGKTSLLLQAAIELLTKNPQSTVVYIATRVMERMPLHIHLMSKLNIDIGKRLFIYYFTSTDELINWLSQYHARSDFPIAFLVDDLHDFISKDFTKWTRSNSKPEILSFIIRNIMDLASWTREKSNHPCYVYTASQDLIKYTTNLDSSDGGLQMEEVHWTQLPVYSSLSVYISHIFKLESKSQPGEFVLVNEVNSRSITFSISESEIYLRSVDQIILAGADEAEAEEVPGHRRR